ncbi:hypothetical protein DSCA_07520 [Desulfosarcina alkanivorans]|uniref:Uncharacterized protein n=1 Tax=Desulfosarcina alkanivorans TaxID=571177 RepID=A0A5K7YBP5_9BACT|nr:hypothetical protein [Desulfosarcina alkanivorans]BBO66822.1 hypothetical protein DSCA_07520 [Desulfosarcina alkanivorans]
MDIRCTLNLPQRINESGRAATVPLALRAGDVLSASVLDVEKGNDALLSFDGFKAYARMPLPMVAGQDVQIRVDPTADRLRMVMIPESGMPTNAEDVDRLEIRWFEPVSDTPSLFAHSRFLLPGRSFQARITGFEKNGRTLVDFGQFKALAKIDVPVSRGQTITLKVVNSEHGGTFTVAPDGRSSGINPAAPSMAGLVSVRGEEGGAPAKTVGPTAPPTVADAAVVREQIQYLRHRAVQPEKAVSVPFPSGLKAALTHLDQALQPANATGNPTTLAARVREFVENSGLYFEKRLESVIRGLQDGPASRTTGELAAQPAIRDVMLKDLKPNLLILKQFLDLQPMDTPGADRHLLETLKQVVQRAVTNIEHQQTMATEKPVDPDLFQAFSHLLFLSDTPRNARLKVFYAKKARDDAQKPPRVALLLEMDTLGTVRSDLWMVGKDLNITFFVQDTGAKTAIETGCHCIGQKLDNIFHTVAVRVVVNKKKIDEFEDDDPAPCDGRLVDLNI